MASTMRSLARGLPKPAPVEQKQKEPVAHVQAKPDPLPDPVVVNETVVEAAPVLEDPEALINVDSAQPEPETTVDTTGAAETPAQVEPEVATVPEAAPEPVQPKPTPEKKAKPKPPPKKPKAADQKKVNTPKVETDV